jgi:acetylornithine deacetylase/succinyl-diaminopimelate desuccinylase-like protein
VGRSEIHQRVEAQLSNQRNRELLQEILRRPCVAQTMPNSDCPRWIEEQLRALGAQVSVRTVGPVSLDRIKEPRVNPMIVGTIGSPTGRKLILEGHYDTVPVDPNTWQHNPFGGEEINGRIYGRGAVDSKGAAAMMLAAMEAVLHAGIELKGQVVMAATGDGDSGGSHWRLIADSGLADDAQWIISGEPTFWKDTGEVGICNAHHGMIPFQLIVHGVPSHMYRPQRDGVDGIWESQRAIGGLADIDSRLTHERWEWFQPRLNLTNIRSSGISYLQPKTTINGSVFTAPGMTAVSVRDDLRAALNEVQRSDGKLTYDIEIGPERWHPTEVPVDDPIVSAMSEAVREATGREPRLGVFRLVWSGAPEVFTRLRPGELSGYPRAITFGPGDCLLAHMGDEHITLEDAMIAAKVYARAIVDLLT